MVALIPWVPWVTRGQEAPRSLLTGRCALDLPLDAGQGFDQLRFLVQGDRTWLFERDAQTAGLRWRLRSTAQDSLPGTSAGLSRTRKKWRDGALWMLSGNRISRWDPALRQWLLKADPPLEFMDFEVDMTGRILLVGTADPRTRSYRALLEAVDESGHRTSILAPYPDPGCLEWGKKVSPVAAATLQAGYESVQIQEFTLLFNPLARRLFVFRPLEDRIKEINLGLPLRGYPDLVKPAPMEDLCWQVLPKDASEAWVVLNRPVAEGPGGVTAIPLDLFEAQAGEPQLLQGLRLPLFPDPSGQLAGLEDALAAFAKIQSLQREPRPTAASHP